MRIAHLAFDLGLGRQRRHRVDDNNVDRTGAHQHVRNLECLLTGVGLRDEEFIDIDAEFLRVVRVEGMLCVDKGRCTAQLLRLGDDLQSQCRLARCLRTIDFNHSSSR